MRRCLILFLLIFIFSGCGKRDEKTALKIGSINISAQEFDSAFNASNSSIKGPMGKERFLESYISRKLILKEAENLGLDKDPEFLESVQIFWEQTLLKHVLTKKSKEIGSTINVGDNEVVEYFEKRKEMNFPDKTLQDVYPQIKWILLQQKQGQALQEWVESLEKKVNVEVDHLLLGIVPVK